MSLNGESSSGATAGDRKNMNRFPFEMMKKMENMSQEASGSSEACSMTTYRQAIVRKIQKKCHKSLNCGIRSTSHPLTAVKSILFSLIQYQFVTRNDAVNTPGLTTMKKLVEVENILFPKSCSEAELKDSVSKLIRYVQEVDKWNRLVRKNKRTYRDKNVPGNSSAANDESKETQEIESFVNLLEKLTLQ